VLRNNRREYRLNAKTESTRAATICAGEALLDLLRRRGVDCLFANSGTDFAPLIEGMASANAAGLPVVRALLVPHENVAVGMAYGVAMVTGRPQAVMVHVNVGTANALCGLINASRENVPMLLMAGRTPLFESGAPGARSLNIHWAQEMFDQAGMVREHVKWDYELRGASQLESVLDRALAIAGTEPKGPVYLTLPREVLAQPAATLASPEQALMVTATAGLPDAEEVTRIARLLAGAENPLVITSRAGRDPRAVPLLAALAERHALPVIEYRPKHLSLPSDHSMHGGFEVDPWLDDADAILVLDCDVPWIPGIKAPRVGVPVVQAGIDPLFGRYPTRGFPSSIALTASPADLIAALGPAMDAAADASAAQRIAARRERIAARARARAAQAANAIDDARRRKPMGFSWATHCLSEAAGEDAIFVIEYPLVRAAMRTVRPGSFFGSSPVGGLGWGVPAALGAKLAAPERLVIAAVGDGSYMFSNPLACHQTAAEHGLATLTVVFNNGGYGAVERATLSMYPHGQAARDGASLAWFGRLPAFERVIEACGGYGERVEDAATLPGALQRALHAVRVEHRPALLNVIGA
jgi:acetolactate synthase-1/2/3 large subunit